MKNLLFLLSFFIFSLSFSQNRPFSISGNVLSDTNEPLESATIYLESVKDSSLITYTITNRNGAFSLKGRTYETELNLFISYIGYATYHQQLTLEDEAIELGEIKMVTDENTLDEVVIRSRAPITIKKDTLEFNVSSFKTKEDATVEDLLKELPGVEVAEDGSILVNGKPVNRILVNGKPFFGDDPTIATRNLTKEMIEKVQVVDTKTDAEAFAGEEGDRDNKTINLTISEEKNKGTFGRLSAGGGTDERFEYAGIVNRFDNDTRFSVLFGGNNTNSPGFSFGEIQKMFGGGRSIMVTSGGAFRIDDMSFGFGDGIINSRNAGASYADAYGKKTDISVDYFYSGANSFNESEVNRETILPETNFFTVTKSRSDADSDSHSANMRFDIKADSTLLINIRPSFRHSSAESVSSREEFTAANNGEVMNESSVNNLFKSTASTFRNTIDMTKRFGAKGRFLQVTLTNEWSTNKSDRYLNSEVAVFGENPIQETRNQFTDKDEKFSSIHTSVKYQMPLVESLFLNFNYSYRDDKRENLESTFDFDTATEDFTLFNPLLSTDFIYKNSRSTPGMGLSLRKEKWSFSVDAGYVFLTMESTDNLRPELQLKRDFKALEYSTNLNYTIGAGKQLYTGYNLRNAAPLLSQLQPMQDITNPLFVITGNPDLKPSNIHSFYGGYNSFNMQSGSNIYVYSNLSYTKDKVVSNTVIDENFIQNTTYDNVSGDINGQISIGYRKTVKIDTIHSIRYNVGGYTSINKNINFFDSNQYTSNRNMIGPNAGLTYTWKNTLEISPTYRLNYTSAKYDIDFFDDQKFLSHNLRFQTALFVPKKVEWRNDINFNYNPDVMSGFQRSSWFWNTTVSYKVLKDAGLLSLKVYDLLNQNTNARRTASHNYIQDSQNTILQRYVMLSFSWKFNSLGKKGETSGGFDFW